MNIPELIHKAIAAREFAYAPYSNFWRRAQRS